MIIRSIISNWIALIISAALSLLLAPMLIHGLGSVYYGMWALVASVIDYYGLLDLGISRTLQRFVACHVGAGGRNALTETFTTGLVLSLMVVLAIVITTGAVAGVLPRFFHVSGADVIRFKSVFLLCGASVAVSFPARVMGAYLRGLQRYDVSNGIAISASLLRAVLLVGVLRHGLGVIAVAGVTFCVALFTVVAHALAVRRCDAMLHPSLSAVRWLRLREMLGFSVYAFIATVGDYFRFHLDSTVIARCLTIALITPFSVASLLITSLMSVVAAVSSPFLTELSRLAGGENVTELRLSFLRALRLTSLFALVGSFLLILDGRALIRLWLGPGFDVSYSILVVLVIGYAVALCQSPSILLLYAKEKHKVLAYWTLAEGGANLILSVWLVHRIGLIGVAVGTAIPMLIVKLTVQPWYTLRVSGVSLRQYALRGLCPGLTVAVLVTILSCVFHLNRAATVPQFAVLLAVQMALSLGFSWMFVLEHTERSAVRKGVRRTMVMLQKAWA